MFGFGGIVRHFKARSKASRVADLLLQDARKSHPKAHIEFSSSNSAESSASVRRRLVKDISSVLKDPHEGLFNEAFQQWYEARDCADAREKERKAYIMEWLLEKPENQKYKPTQHVRAIAPNAQESLYKLLTRNMSGQEIYRLCRDNKAKAGKTGWLFEAPPEEQSLFPKEKEPTIISFMPQTKRDALFSNFINSLSDKERGALSDRLQATLSLIDFPKNDQSILSQEYIQTLPDESKNRLYDVINQEFSPEKIIRESRKYLQNMSPVEIARRMTESYGVSNDTKLPLLLPICESDSNGTSRVKIDYLLGYDVRSVIAETIDGTVSIYTKYTNALEAQTKLDRKDSTESGSVSSAPTVVSGIKDMRLPPIESMMFRSPQMANGAIDRGNSSIRSDDNSITLTNSSATLSQVSHGGLVAVDVDQGVSPYGRKLGIMVARTATAMNSHQVVSPLYSNKSSIVSTSSDTLHERQIGTSFAGDGVVPPVGGKLKSLAAGGLSRFNLDTLPLPKSPFDPLVPSKSAKGAASHSPARTLPGQMPPSHSR
jgi:hypothetical protein